MINKKLRAQNKKKINLILSAVGERMSAPCFRDELDGFFDFRKCSDFARRFFFEQLGGLGPRTGAKEMGDYGETLEPYQNGFLSFLNTEDGFIAGYSPDDQEALFARLYATRDEEDGVVAVTFDVLDPNRIKDVEERDEFDTDDAFLRVEREGGITTVLLKEGEPRNPNRIAEFDKRNVYLADVSKAGKNTFKHDFDGQVVSRHGSFKAEVGMGVTNLVDEVEAFRNGYPTCLTEVEDDGSTSPTISTLIRSFRGVPINPFSVSFSGVFKTGDFEHLSVTTIGDEDHDLIGFQHDFCKPDKDGVLGLWETEDAVEVAPNNWGIEEGVLEGAEIVLNPPFLYEVKDMTSGKTLFEIDLEDDIMAMEKENEKNPAPFKEFRFPKGFNPTRSKNMTILELADKLGKFVGFEENVETNEQ